jgi:S-adenosyl-L-methionine hydrolase (adenosine-forming)
MTANIQKSTPYRLIALLTDFGMRDGYVGVMKGVVKRINPMLDVVDLSHEIPPQNIAAARFSLMNAYSYFPDGTVYIAVVDPGVGGNRRAIAIELSNNLDHNFQNNFKTNFLVGPDNGLFSGVISQNQIIRVIELTNTDYWLTSHASKTFHGRDIFAPTGAHLATGIPIQNLGREIDPASLIKLNINPCLETSTGISGCIQYIDYFGNLITNIPHTYIEGKTWSLQVTGLIIRGCNTYADVPLGEAIALAGSDGWLEIAVNGGNAQSQLQITLGSMVILHILGDIY